MERIASFCVNHLTLMPGLYVSRRDAVGNECVTTFDVRLKAPNREPVLDPAAMHTIEHLGATFMRNHPLWGKHIIYWGGMCCLTGFYLLVGGERNSHDVFELVRETFEFIANYEGEIPGATPRECGNYSYQNLELAKVEAKRYLIELRNVKTEYPE